MPQYRRAFVPGGCFFFTLVTHRREPVFADAHARQLLGDVFRRCLEWRPCTTEAVVLLPDHLHAIWTMPPRDSGYSARWGWIKKEFTKSWLASQGIEQPVSDGRRRERRRGVWQPRFWEHQLRDEHDFERHFDYLHYNPVKHGYVSRPVDWLPSSFHRWREAGVYPSNWATDEPLDFSDIATTAFE